MNKKLSIHDFAFRGLLAEESLDRAGRKRSTSIDLSTQEIESILSISELDSSLVAPARQMAAVYTTIAAFENSVRTLVRSVLIEAHGENWWKEAVPSSIRKTAEKRLEDEKATRWHSQRGENPINYTMLGNLAKIIEQNWDLFEPFVRSVEWVKGIFVSIEKSRNVIMHSGMLDREDVERIGILIRDWIKQVGA